MGLRGFLPELHRRRVIGVAVAYVAAAIVLLEVLTHLFHNFEAPHWVLKVLTTLLILGLPVACLLAWGFEFKEGVIRAVPRAKKNEPAALPAPDATASPSIAVLPFADMSAEHDQQYLGDGIAEELLNALASIEGLNVAARTSSFSFAGKVASMTEIGETLHVRHVLEGSVRRSGQKLRVTAQLIDVKSGFHLFTQGYDREVQDIFSIQNDIAHEIASALLPKLGLSRDVMLVRQGTTNLEAYNLKLKAHQWLLSPDPTTASTAVEQLRHACALDPRYSDAWGDLAYVLGYMSTWTGEPVPLILESYAAATVALTLAPDNVVGLLCQAYLAIVIRHDAASAASYYERARAAGAELSLWAFQRAYLHDGPLGHYAEAIAALTEAERMDPLAPNLKHALMEMYVASGRIADAVSTAEAVERLPAKGPEAIAICGHAFLAAGDAKRAREYLVQLEPARHSESAVGIPLRLALDAATGDIADARGLLDRMLQQYLDGHTVSAYLIGEAYKSVGDHDEAFEWWTRSIERYEGWAFTLLPARNRNHPVIGKDPRFMALLKRMGLQD